MKRILILLMFVPFIGLGQTSTENYVKTTTYKKETTDGTYDAISGATLTANQKSVSVNYFDGLGRLKQAVNARAGGGGEDLVTHFEYDQYGRQTKEFLPYANSYNNLNIRTGDIEYATQSFYKSKYSDDFLNMSTTAVNAYSEKTLESSPLNRVFEQGAPGEDWNIGTTFAAKGYSNNSHTIKFEYDTNAANEVKIYYVTTNFSNNTYTPTLQGGSSSYNAGELIKTVTKDENWQAGQQYDKDHTTEEFKNKQGQVVLKRTYNNNIPHNTYYVYDDFGNLTYVLPPKAEISASGSTPTDKSRVTANWSEFMDNPIGGGGGSAYIEIVNSQLILSMSAGFTTQSLKTNGVVKILGWNDVADMTIGDFAGGNYTAFIRNGNLHIEGNGTPVGGLNSSFNINLNTNDITDQLDNLCYQYKYDNRNRLVEKKIPGKGWEYIIYDILDRPVMTQDANLRTSYKWLFTKYDVLGRVAYTGIYTHGSTFNQSQMQSHFNNSSTQTGPKLLYESRHSTENGSSYIRNHYTNYQFPYYNANFTSTEILTVNYYDNYVFNRAGSGTSVSTNYVINNVNYTRNSTNNVKGLQTGSKVKILDTNNWITTVSYYDHKARLVYIYNKNEYLNTTDIVESKLDDFTGKVLETKTTHTKDSNNPIVTIDKFTYDHADRLKKQTQNINSALLDEVIVENAYDNLGQLVSKDVGGKTNQSRLQNIDYKYNVRGWLKNINDIGNSNSSITLGSSDLFGFEINYNNPSSGTALYNGNISQTLWKSTSSNPSGNVISNRYNYSYDALNRINSALDNTGRYDVWGILYDKNGNITSLKRDGQLGSTYSFGQMDNLTYSYDIGNKLLKVSDALSNDQYGFKDDAVNNNNDSSNDYAYDNNGNMLSDQNKQITNIVYNYLNLPTQITIDNKNIYYTYDATGVKLEKRVSEFGSPNVTQYAGNYIYYQTPGINSPLELQFMNHPEGYINKKSGKLGVNESPYKYVYQYKDHLGNVRLSYKDNNENGTIDPSSEIIEESNYYPFGLKHKGYNDITTSNGNSVAQKFEYNGVEYEESLGLDLYEMDVRMYNPAIGRFNGIDPVTHFSQGTSVAFDNNPIFWADPSGADSQSHEEWVKGIEARWAAVDNGASLHSVFSTSSNGETATDVDHIVNDDEKEAQTIADDLNSIFKKKFGKTPFSVEKTTRLEYKWTFSHFFFEGEAEYVKVETYKIVGSMGFDWDQHYYVRMLKDIIDASSDILVDIIPDKSSYEGATGNGLMSDYYGGHTESSKLVVLSDLLQIYKGNTSHSIGGVALHELLRHIHPDGDIDANVNDMRTYFGLAEGKNHYGVRVESNMSIRRVTKDNYKKEPVKIKN